MAVGNVEPMAVRTDGQQADWALRVARGSAQAPGMQLLAWIKRMSGTNPRQGLPQPIGPSFLRAQCEQRCKGERENSLRSSCLSKASARPCLTAPGSEHEPATQSWTFRSTQSCFELVPQVMQGLRSQQRQAVLVVSTAVKVLQGCGRDHQKDTKILQAEDAS
eukprot:4024611-Pleurochrysis_carterae.AAC.1